MPGFLHNTSQSNRENGFLSFIRLIGTCYFKKHLRAFVALKGHKIQHICITCGTPHYNDRKAQAVVPANKGGS